MITRVVRKTKSLCDLSLENLVEDLCDASGRSRVDLLVLMLACC